MLIVKEGASLQFFMVQTPTGAKPRWFKGADRLDKNKKNALGYRPAKITASMGDMFLVQVEGKEHTVYLADADIPGFIDV